jgi:hypothetical protein
LSKAKLKKKAGLANKVCLPVDKLRLSNEVKEKEK